MEGWVWGAHTKWQRGRDARVSEGPVQLWRLGDQQRLAVGQHREGGASAAGASAAFCWPEENWGSRWGRYWEGSVSARQLS